MYILIPIHNNIAETRKCLSCIRTQTYTNYEVIVIDDGSTDNSSEIIKNEYPDTTILQGNGNLWWAGALYEGIKYVSKKAQPNDYVLILNNDLIFDNNYITNLVESSKDNHGAVIGSLCKDQKTGAIVDSGVKIDWKNLKFNLIEVVDDGDDLVRGIDVLSTRGLLIPINIILKIGNFIPDKLRHYLSDYEYTIRMKKHGYTLLTSKKAIAFLNSENTGIHLKWDEKYTLKDLYRTIFSVKSSSNLKAWLFFIHLCCPLPYKPVCYWRITFGKIIEIIKNHLRR
ncbi:MAG: glycosyltransferase family 2 protein [Candidatus Subteraquimicrobiales bacterium]|nr:glycosyltransferase family 2 protein [Candidatus Subteraquimicrobiales bacterium]